MTQMMMLSGSDNTAEHNVYSIQDILQRMMRLSIVCSICSTWEKEGDWWKFIWCKAPPLGCDFKHKCPINPSQPPSPEPSGLGLPLAGSMRQSNEFNCTCTPINLVKVFTLQTIPTRFRWVGEDSGGHFHRQPQGYEAVGRIPLVGIKKTIVSY